MKNTEERGGNFVFCFLVKESFFFSWIQKALSDQMWTKNATKFIIIPDFIKCWTSLLIC